MDIRQQRRAYRRLAVRSCQDVFEASLHELAGFCGTERSALQLVRSAGYLGIPELSHQGMQRFAWRLLDNADVATRRHGCSLHAIWDILEGARPLGRAPLLLAPRAASAQGKATGGDAALAEQLAMLYESVCGREIQGLNGCIDAWSTDGSLGLRGLLSGDLLAKALTESVQSLPGSPGTDGAGALYLGLLHARNLRRSLPLLGMQLNEDKGAAGRKRLSDRSDSGFAVTIPMPLGRD